MNKTQNPPTIVWFRNDLRLHDHPALYAATHAAGSQILPLFIVDPAIQQSPLASHNRWRYLQDCLQDLQNQLRQKGGDLFIYSGDPAKVLASVARVVGAGRVVATKDYSPFAIKRDAVVRSALQAIEVQLDLYPGRLIVDDVEMIRSKAGTIHKVFTPFWRAWQQVPRRPIASTPSRVTVPKGLATTPVPLLYDKKSPLLSPHVIDGGETAALARRDRFFSNAIHDYVSQQNNLARDGTSRLGADLHFGTISALELSQIAPQSPGAEAWVRQLAWRDFYHYVLFYNPHNSQRAFQEKYRSLDWDNNPDMLAAWKQGRTGYPIVDAAMRQLKAEGFMHNRARLIVGSFLVKDLWIDWRQGEDYFKQLLLDGDQANNNGNWQWIASVGVDPAPVYRRLYNPVSQAKVYDPDGEYIRRYVPELQKVPLTYLAEPWTMPVSVQKSCGVTLGKDYPLPIIDHATARQRALQHYHQAAADANKN